MITIDLRDRMIKKNLEAIKELKDSGLFTDEEIQKLYDKQVEEDKKKDCVA